MVHPRVAQAVSELWAVLKDLLWMVMNQLAADVPCSINKWVFPKIGVPQNGWFIMENPIKMDDLGAHLFLETSKSRIDMIRHVSFWCHFAGCQTRWKTA